MNYTNSSLKYLYYFLFLGTRAHPNKTTTTNNKRRNEEVLLEPQPTSDIPHVSHVSPPHGGESYHRGTMNRPVHPAMKSSIDFGVGGGGGGGGGGWQQRPTISQFCFFLT